MFDKKEIRDLLISIVLLGIIFGFDDGAKTFIFKNWLLNLIGITVLAGISLIIREGVIKLVAYNHEVDSRYELWNIDRIWFGKYGKLSKSMPAGIILGALFTFMSRGKFFFTAIGKHDFRENLALRSGRFPKLFLEDIEEAKIIFWGMMSHILLIVIAVIIAKFSTLTLTQFIMINFYLAIFMLLPLSSLDGSKIFFGSIFLWIFSLVFVVISFLFLKYGLLSGLLIAFIVALAVVSVYAALYD